jgi:putative membrane protein
MKTTNCIALSVAMVLVAACGHEEPPKTAYQAAPSTPPPAPAEALSATTPMVGSTSADAPREGPRVGNTEAQPATPMTDGQILQVTHVANLGEIEKARLALSKTTNPRLRSVARMVVQDHSQADDKAMVLGKKWNLERGPSGASDSLEADDQHAVQTLRVETGQDFDADYIAMQIREHQALLDILDQKLVVGTTNPDFKAYLVQFRAAIASHLRLERDLQGNLQP